MDPIEAVVEVGETELALTALEFKLLLQFVARPGDTSLDFFAVKDLPATYVCDGSILRAAGIANSGLTLVALAYRLAEHLRAKA